MVTTPYTDDQLASAVAASHSWRGVLRALGLTDTSAGSMRAARRRADRLGIDHSHFTGMRTWSDADLTAAVRSARSWSAVAVAMGVSSDGRTLKSMKARAARLGLDTKHLAGVTPQPDLAQVPDADPAHLRDAGPMLAAAWFTLRGYRISWPLEPQRYDLLVERDGEVLRVQVKTTTHSPAGQPVVSLSTTSRHGRTVYTKEDIDYVFVIDAELMGYLIPIEAVQGRQALTLRAYRDRAVGVLGHWTRTRPA